MVCLHAFKFPPDLIALNAKQRGLCWCCMVVMGGMSLLCFQMGPSEELPQSQVSSWSMGCCRFHIAAVHSTRA